MTKRSKVIKLEAIRYSLSGLIREGGLPLRDRMDLLKMHAKIETLLKPYEGVTLYDESANVGC